MTVTREEIHDAIDKMLDKWRMEDPLNIERGRIYVEVQIENGKKTITTGEREIVK